MKEMITVWENNFFTVELYGRLRALECKELLLGIAREWGFLDGHIVIVMYNLHMKYPFVLLFKALNLIKI